jgi:hypothetical protein
MVYLPLGRVELGTLKEPTSPVFEIKVSPQVDFDSKTQPVGMKKITMLLDNTEFSLDSRAQFIENFNSLKVIKEELRKKGNEFRSKK